jgi:HK97 family phage major capsid protein
MSEKWEPTSEQLREIGDAVGKEVLDQIRPALSTIEKKLPLTEKIESGEYSGYWANKMLTSREVRLLDNGGFKTFGEFLRSVRLNPKDTRLAPLYTKAGLSEGSETAGGFTVPPQFNAQVLMVALEMAVMRGSNPMAFPMATDMLTIPRVNDTTHASTVFGGVVAQWGTEGGTLTEKTPTFGMVELVAHKLWGYTYMSNELLADNAVGLEALLTRMFGEAIAFYEDDAFINGTGEGRPLGYSKGSAFLSANRSAASKVAIADIANMLSRMLPASLGRCVWFANPNVLAQLIQLGSTYMTWQNVAGANPLPATLFGRPIRFTEKCAALGTANDIALIDPSYYIIADRSPVEISASPHVRFTTDETAWRFTKRLDGQPWIDSKLTMKAGGTVSPFVTLYTATTGGD